MPIFGPPCISELLRLQPTGLDRRVQGDDCPRKETEPHGTNACDSSPQLKRTHFTEVMHVACARKLQWSKSQIFKCQRTLSTVAYTAAQLPNGSRGSSFFSTSLTFWF